ncbi:MAG TPA: hypothetical protein PKI46_07365, partial [Bacteroidales bacterium]|nr:hypothetical protein [Bacteroidales bacterium]
FTEVTQEGNLIIKRVELTQEQKELLNTKDNYGWDITSSMENGTFKYTLTLPNIYDNTNVEVKYTEDGNNYESIQTNSIENNRIVINGLDHFTVFIVINPLPTGVSNGGTCTVASINGTCYNTIQGAINAASDGETINVASGTYTENIVINKAITLQGDNSNIPTINPSNTFNPILQVSTSGVTIKNIKIQGTGTNSHGISLLNGTNNLTLENVSSINNGGNGIEISLYDYQGPISNLTLNNCNLSNNNIGFRTGSTTKVKTLTITNTNAENNKTAGLYFNGPITGLTLDGGRYNNNKGSSNPTNGLGIYAVNFNNFPDGEKENMVLKNFTANGNIRGVIINQAYGPFSISNAEISNNSEEGLAVAPGANISGLSFDNIKANNNPKWGFWLISYLGYTINNVTITNSSFNISTGTSGYEGTGLYLYAATGSTLSNVNISNTSMNGNRIGLYMRTVDSTSTIRNIKAENSSFVGNTQYGAYNNDLISRTIDFNFNVTNTMFL